jgi:hypothetical protein
LSYAFSPELSLELKELQNNLNLHNYSTSKVIPRRVLIWINLLNLLILFGYTQSELSNRLRSPSPEILPKPLPSPPPPLPVSPHHENSLYHHLLYICLELYYLRLFRAGQNLVGMFLSMEGVRLQRWKGAGIHALFLHMIENTDHHSL